MPFLLHSYTIGWNSGSVKMIFHLTHLGFLTQIHCPEAISKRMIQRLSGMCPEINIWVLNDLHLGMLKKSVLYRIHKLMGRFSNIRNIISYNHISFTANVYNILYTYWYNKSGQFQVDGWSWWMWRADKNWLSSSTTNWNTLWIQT